MFGSSYFSVSIKTYLAFPVINCRAGHAWILSRQRSGQWALRGKLFPQLVECIFVFVVFILDAEIMSITQHGIKIRRISQDKGHGKPGRRMNDRRLPKNNPNPKHFSFYGLPVCSLSLICLYLCKKILHACICAPTAGCTVFPSFPL